MTTLSRQDAFLILPRTDNLKSNLPPFFSGRMSMGSSLAEVVLPIPRSSIYVYRVPDGLSGRVRKGVRVVVPFGKRKITGVVVGFSEMCGPGVEIKDILDAPDQGPVFDRGMLEFCRWVADYYLCGWGEVLKTALPAGIGFQSSLKLLLVSPYERATPEDLKFRTDIEREIFELLQKRREITVATIRRRFGSASSRRAVASMTRRGIVEVRSVVQGPRVREKRERFVYLVPRDRRWVEVESESLGRSAPRQADCLRSLASRGGRASTVALAQEGFDAGLVRALANRRFVKIISEEVARDPYAGKGFNAPEEWPPTPEQAEAIRELEKAISSNSFRAVLLNGVTGSGKSFVYLRAIQHTLSLGRGAILLVPEIGLTAQTVRPFRGAFGETVAVLHSALSEGERYDAWKGVLNGKKKVVIGTRSAIFAPVRELGLIILDEEHDGSYKEHERDPRYNARDLAVMRAKRSGATALLGSATPSLESAFNGNLGKFRCLRMRHRIDNRPLAEVILVDMRKEGGRGVLFSKPLRERIKDRLKSEERIILLQNRRGYAPYVQCFDCGEVIRCRNCSVSVTFHAAGRRMICHYCGLSNPAPSVCPSCKGPGLNYGGVGTQRVEEALLSQFPGVRILRFDVDTTRRKGSHDRFLDAFRKGKADILLGTQMVAKGFDFPGVTLVGVISADTTLNLPDFRAPERTFQLLTQVAGRSGRGERKGEVVVQTYQPEAESVRNACAQDFDAFFEKELENRRALNYPPFGRLVSFLFRGSEESTVMGESEIFGGYLREGASGSGVEILGPAAAPLSRLKGAYRWQVVLKGTSSSSLRQVARQAIDRFGVRQRSGVRMNVDVDPVSML